MSTASPLAVMEEKTKSHQGSKTRPNEPSGLLGLKADRGGSWSLMAVDETVGEKVS